MNIIDLMHEFSSEPWMAEALCAQADPDHWFPSHGANNGYAKKICNRCPVREPCLEFALRNLEQDGIWGGKSIRERRKLMERPHGPPMRTHCMKGHEYARFGRDHRGACRKCRADWHKERQRQRKGAA